MVCAKGLTSDKRAQIPILWKENISTRSIAKKLSISQTVVVKTIKKFQKQNEFKLRVQFGRPKLTSVQVDIAIIKAAKFSQRELFFAL